MLAGSLAITQESSDAGTEDEAIDDPDLLSLIMEAEQEPENFEEPLPDWVTPPRWYRSNIGGMMLEEVLSRLAAIRNQYALVSDFISREDLPEILLPYYDDHYIEIRVLYKKGVEYRRQWIFRDANGLYRLVAVFSDAAAEADEAEKDSAGSGKPGQSHESDNGNGAANDSETAVNSDGVGGSEGEDGEEAELALITEPGDHRVFIYKNLIGFIEIYGDNLLIERELVFLGDDEVQETVYVYNKGTLIRSEAMQRSLSNDSGEPRKIFTDYFRYNRAGSLRTIERTFHVQLDSEKTRLTFAHRVLEDASKSMFLTDQLYLTSDFHDDPSVSTDEKMVFTTDERQRILTQTLLDSEGEVIWSVRNTWSGDRIVSALKTEGEEQRLNEYEYNSNGDRIVERNFHNGVLQRQVFTEGNRETEELFMNGAVVLRAIWEDNRKISEQRVRPGDREQ